MKFNLIATLLTLICLTGCDKVNFTEPEKKEATSIPKVVITPPLEAKAPPIVKKAFDPECQNQVDNWYRTENKILEKPAEVVVIALYDFYDAKGIVGCKRFIENEQTRVFCNGINGKINLTTEEETNLIKLDDLIELQDKRFITDKKELKELYMTKSKICAGN